MKIEKKSFKKVFRATKKYKYFFVFIIFFFIFGFNIGQADAAITYVGGRGAGRAGATSTVTVPINAGLTGGSGAAALAGDLVVVTISVGSAARAPVVTPTGYTALTVQRTTATTYDTNVQTSYKFMPATPDVSVIIPSTGSTADGQGYTVHVFRGVDSASPLDTTSTYAVGTGANNRPNPAAITPLSAGAWIYFGGGGAAGTGTTLYTASYLTNFLTYNGADTNDGTVGAGYYSAWSSGAYDGAVWTGGSAVTTSSWGATSVVLKPQANAVPTVTTPTVIDITTTGATLGANVTSAGYPATVTARGTCWGTSPSPTTNCLAEGGTITGVFTHARTGFSASTLYYYRGYATNTTGTAYSDDGSFTTLGVPAVTTPTVTSITTTTATLGANVTSLGVPASISARGTCWGTSPSPTTNCLAEGGITTGVFTHARTGFSANTLYYYRGYATNTTGTAYSDDGSFTTLGVPTAPTFTDTDGTNQIAFNNINQNSTTPTFRVSATNTSNLNRFQLELNTVSNFTGTAYNQTFSGTYTSGVPYNLTASGLSPSLPATNGITYYVRARASADGGTNYSAWTTITKTFTYKSSGNPTWFQTTDEQFNTGTANGVIISSNSVQLGASGSWYNTGWNYRKKISIDHTKVGSGSLTDFPVLFSKTDTDLISKARADGFDILFTSSDGTTKLSHEIEKYSSSTGELITWIKIPSISSSVNTDIYIYYGNGTASNQQNITGTWDLNYTGIWHLNNIFSDATSNANNGTNTGTTDVVGKIANGRGYVRSDGADFITVTGLMDSPANVTLSGWGTLTSRDTNGAHLISIGDYLAINVDDVTDGYLGSFYDAGWGLTKSLPKLNPAGSGWHYFVYTFDDTSNAQSLYMDGVLVGSGTFANPIMYSGQGSNTVIGSHANGNANFDFDGSIDEVRVSNSVRSTGWVQAEYANQSSPSTFYNVGSEETSANDNGSITSPAINFNLVPGSTTWGQASWSETETYGSVSMQVYYDAGSGCNTIIPNTALTGNSTGFATSPINISGLNTTTYANICLKSTLIYSGGTPYLNDWTVSWINGPTTTLVNGTDGGNSTIAPGASATEIDRFSLSTNTGTDTVTGMTVTLAGNASAYTNIATVDVQTTAGVSKCSLTPTSNIVLLTSCAIAVTTTPTEYKIMITPKTHANMPAVPGASYATTATVTSITATNTPAGTDSGSATITVDNASPGAVTASTATAGDTVVNLAWTNPSNSDFTTNGTVVVLRHAGTAVSTVPVEGTTYTIGNIISATDTVACVVTGSAPATTCQDTGLTNSTVYHYKIFTRDSNGNYNTGTVPTGSPATPVVSNVSISSIANQNFSVGQASIPISTISITDKITSPVITSANDIRIKIPATFNMTWDATDTLANIGGVAWAKTGALSSGSTVTVTYEDGNKTVVVPVTTNFAASDSITVYGLSFNNFSSVSSSDNLELEINNAGTTADEDDKTIAISSALLPYWQDGKSVGNLTSTADWQEISGITQSTLSANSSSLWMQSDGSINKIFAVATSNASSMGEWTLSGVTGVDYEDLSSARINNQSYIYLADIGDNASARSTITVYRIIEPTITGSNGTVDAGNIETITMQYPSGSLPSHKDAETLLVDPDTGDMYIITKREAVAGVYFLAHAASYSGTQTLTDLGNMFDIPDVSSIAASGNAVGGNISPNGREILIKSYDVLYLFPRDKGTQTIIQALQGTPTEVNSYVGGGNTTYRKSHPSQEPQGEAVTFDYYGNDYYTASEFVSTEGSTATQYPLFKYDRLADTPTSITLQEGVSPDGSYAGTLDTYIWDTNPAVNYGGDATIIADTAVGVETDQRKGLLKFDVSSIPSNATIVGARLDLYVSTEGQGWKIHRMLVDWNESSTYNSLTAGVDDDNIEASSVEDNRNGITLDTILGSIRNNMNIATVQGWVDGTYPNYGWLLEATDLATGDGQQFDSSEGATSTQRPKLILRYIVTSSVTRPTVTTGAVTSITSTTATGNGNITNIGGENNDLRGVVYHTSSHADPGNVAPASSAYTLKVEESGSFTTGAFTESITGLANGTIYYVRAYSHNSVGYAYGAEVSFTTLTPSNPIPTTTSISPTSKNIGDSGFALTVNGTNFISGTVAFFNGLSRTTNYVSATQLTASILGSDLASAGSFLVLANNPTPGGGDSNSQIFTVHNVIPNITSIIPTSVPIGSSQFTMTINGVNFVSNSQVKFGGSSRTTTFISSTQLSAVILASDLVSAGTFSITVYNGTTGETSAAQQFTVGPLGRREFNYSRTFYGSASLRK